MIVIRFSTPAYSKMASDPDPIGIDVVGIEVTAGFAQGDRKPDPRLPAGSAQFDNALGADGHRQLAEQSAIGLRDIGVALASPGGGEGLQCPPLVFVLGKQGL